ncbi:hypothetical protein ACJX0J_005266 (mitochondrion) [Zea mays]
MELFSNIKYKGLGLVEYSSMHGIAQGYPLYYLAYLLEKKRKIGTTCLPPILSISRWHLLKIGSILLALIAVNRLRLDLEELSHTGKVPHFSKFFYDIDLKPPHIDRICRSLKLIDHSSLCQHDLSKDQKLHHHIIWNRLLIGIGEETGFLRNRIIR